MKLIIKRVLKSTIIGVITIFNSLFAIALSCLVAYCLNTNYNNQYIALSGFIIVFLVMANFVYDLAGDIKYEDNAEFIVHTHDNDVIWLVAEARRLQKELEHQKFLVENYKIRLEDLESKIRSENR
jgi:H+/Cl- antiporter ClcA